MIVANDRDLNYHLMHPGGESYPGDPNAAFCLDGVYHLHYILKHPFVDHDSFSFIKRHQPGHVALGLADDEISALVHRPRHVQRRFGPVSECSLSF